tara:strand:- start:467 stop:826 length:360 start_codon:yes stop_codon:yes gene_type:complete
MNNISYSVIEVCDSSNNEIIDIKELSNNIMISNNNDDEKANELVALEIFYTENYTVKELQKIAGYYNIPIRKLKKDQLVNKIIDFEMNDENTEIVSRRKLLNFYYEELKGDHYFSTFVI